MLQNNTQKKEEKKRETAMDLSLFYDHFMDTIEARSDGIAQNTKHFCVAILMCTLL